ncbi:MFS transporter [Pseudorhodobacter sp.]|uniref:MFS transporter n=1 Tax=Pseudorhodobacter sp. TaxID=1934400 RepID=UPI00264A049C|nr:MFS transporter [Pseudorhodobacter sp.]MDN5787101.1 MFS transporter [Pseudorhodobacter sp.]
MPDLRSPRLAVIAMFILNGALLGIWASRIPAIADAHGLTPNLLGLLLLCLAAGAITSFPLAGRAVDRFGAASVTRIIAVAYCAALVTLGLAPNLPLLALCLFLFGMAHGSMDVSMNVWAAEVEKAAGKPIMASFHAMFSLGAGLAAAMGYFAIKAGTSVPTHFALASLPLGAISLAIASAPWHSARSIARSDGIFAFPKGALVFVGLVGFAAAMGEGAVADWGAVFLNRSLGTTEALATFGYSAFSVAIFVMRMLGDRIIRRFGSTRAARLSGAIALVGVVILTTSTGLPQALTGFCLMGFGYAILFPLAFSRAAADPLISPGRAIASVATLGYGGLLLGPPVIGFIAEATSLRAALLLLALLAAMIIALAPHLQKPAI